MRQSQQLYDDGARYLGGSNRITHPKHRGIPHRIPFVSARVEEHGIRRNVRGLPKLVDVFRRETSQRAVCDHALHRPKPIPVVHDRIRLGIVSPINGQQITVLFKISPIIEREQLLGEGMPIGLYVGIVHGDFMPPDLAPGGSTQNNSGVNIEAYSAAGKAHPYEQAKNQKEHAV